MGDSTHAADHVLRNEMINVRDTALGRLLDFHWLQRQSVQEADAFFLAMVLKPHLADRTTVPAAASLAQRLDCLSDERCSIELKEPRLTLTSGKVYLARAATSSSSCYDAMTIRLAQTRSSGECALPM